MHLSSKILVYGDEISARARDLKDSLKNIITRTEMKVELKNVNPIIMNDYTNYIFTSNNKDAFAIEPTDRRFYLFKLKNKIMDEETAIKLYDLLKKKETFEAFDTFLKNRSIPSKLEDLDNAYKQECILATLPAYIQMFYIHPQYFADTQMRITSIYKKAVEYAKQNNLQWSFTKQKMAKDIKNELPEEYFKRNTINRYYEFPDEKTFVEYLKTQRPQLLIDYI
jgi:hypothetical protein